MAGLILGEMKIVIVLIANQILSLYTLQVLAGFFGVYFILLSGCFVTNLKGKKTLQNIVGKGEKAANQNFLLLPLSFLHSKRQNPQFELHTMYCL